MATFQLAPGEEFVQCPYEKAHRIINNKMSIHLTKCRENHKKECERAGKPLQYGICRFNRNHQFLKKELAYHEDRCPDQYNVVPHLQYHQSDEFRAKLKAERDSFSLSDKGISDVTNKMSCMTVTSSVGNSGEENWDDDAQDGYVPGYAPKQKLASGAYLTMPSGMKPAERKAYRRENVRKFQEQAEREAAEEYGPRSDQPHWRQEPSVASTSLPLGGMNSSSVSKTAPSLPIGLSLQDVMSSQQGTTGTKSSKKKKKNRKKKTGVNDDGDVVASANSQNNVKLAEVMTFTEVSTTGDAHEDSDYDWHDE